MNMESVILDAGEVRKLLGAASGDGALLYIYLKTGNSPADAAQALNLTPARCSCAMATLRQLGLWQEEKQVKIPVGERPVYSEHDVLAADSGDVEFKSLRGEVERLLGRNLNTEELKILLGFIRYLGLPGDVISVLICYCKELGGSRYRQSGGGGSLHPDTECAQHPPAPAEGAAADSWAQSDRRGGALCRQLAGNGFRGRGCCPCL